MPEKLTPEFLKLADLKDVLNNDVIGFLERPILNQSFVWKTSEPDALELLEFDLPYAWLRNDMIMEKLAGFRYVRANFKIRVQINAQPFNAGLLVLMFEPLKSQLKETPSSMADLGGITGYRRVMLDLSTDTSAELTIPFINTISHFDLINGYGGLGKVHLFVYSPLTGQDDVDGTVWITAEDVEVALPTGLPVVIPNSGPAHAKFNMKNNSVKTEKDQVLTTKPPKKKGPISSIADTVNTIAGAVKEVPVIGEVAGAVEWVSGAVSDIASFFGFSKPADVALPVKQTLVVANNFANYDGDSKVKSLAFSYTNETQIPLDVYGTTEDEMSFAHILSRPVYMTRFKMQKSDSQQAIIFKWPSDPRSCRKIIREDPKATPYIPDRYICANTYISYLASFFKFFRGTIVYHFRIIKTCFHSGRIRVFVVPGAVENTPISDIDWDKVHSEVYDIRDTTEFSVSVPYKWNTPWKSIDGIFSNILNSNITPNEPIAMIYVQVINSLRNPSTAADSIEFIVEQAAGDDFQFGVPDVHPEVSLITSVEQLAADYPAIPSYGPAHAAVSLLDSDTGNDLIANKISIGEVVTGWRALLKRYSVWLTQTKSGTEYVTYPYDTATNRSTKDPFDLYSAAAMMYRFVSGSLRISSVLQGDVPSPIIVHRVDSYDKVFSRIEDSGAVLQSKILEPVVELGVPFYQPTVAIPTQLGSPKTSEAGKTDDERYTVLPYNRGTMIRSTEPTTMWRSIGEDFSFGYLLGPPQTLMLHRDRRQCEDNWKNKISTEDLDDALQTADVLNDPDFIAAAQQAFTTYKALVDAVTSPIPNPINIILDNQSGKIFDLAPMTPGTRTPKLLQITADMYAQLVEYYTSICIRTPK